MTRMRFGVVAATLVALAACSNEAPPVAPLPSSSSPTSSASTSPSPTPTPTPSQEPVKALLTAPQVKGLTCEHAWVIPEGTRLLAVRRKSVVVAKGDRAWIHYLTGAKDHTLPADFARSRITLLNIVDNPDHTASKIVPGEEATVAQRSWTDPKLIGVWHCT